MMEQWSGEAKNETMTVKEFKDFSNNSNIVLKDNYNGKIYKNIEKHLEKEVTGFYTHVNIQK